MNRLTPQTAIGSFALVTALLAGAAIGRVLGLGLGEALYLAALALTCSVWTACHLLLRRQRE